MVKQVCDIEYFPDTWFTKWTGGRDDLQICTKWIESDVYNRLLQERFYEITKDMLYYGEFHEDIKIVHYAEYR